MKSELTSKIVAEIGNVAGVARVEEAGSEDGMTAVLAIPVEGQSIVHDVAEYVGKSGITVEELHAERGRLDEVFRQLTAPQ